VVGKVLPGIGKPADHVDLFAAKFVDHLLELREPAGTDAGTNWIHFTLDAVEQHLGGGPTSGDGGLAFPGHGAPRSHRTLWISGTSFFEEVNTRPALALETNNWGPRRATSKLL